MARRVALIVGGGKGAKILLMIPLLLYNCGKEERLMEIVYVMAISLQVCGALILLISSFGNADNKMFSEIANKTSGNPLIGQWIIDIDISEELKSLYLNRVAFMSLAAGYVLGVFGDIGNTNKFTIALFVIAATFGLTFVLYILCKKMADKNQKKYKAKYMDVTGKRFV